MDGRDIVLITGFPSPLARQLLDRCLAAEPEARFELLAHDPARVRVAADALPARVSLLDGDGTAIDFGLSGQEYRELSRRITHLVHLVPAFDAELGAPELERRNVGSMREVLEFGRNAAKLRAIVVQSSTVVSGDAGGLVLETELALGQRFRSPVEETLAVAERMARAAAEKLPVVVARCARVVGDSRTGRLNPFEPLAALIEHVASAGAAFDVPLPLESSPPLHLVSSDVVVDALYRLLNERRAAQRCVHLTDPSSPTLRRLLELVAEAAGRRLGADLPQKRLVRALGAGAGARGRRIRQLFEELPEAVDYDQRNTTELLPDLVYPEFAGYVAALVREAARAVESGGA